MRTSIIIAALLPLIALAQDGEFVLVKGGEIFPSNAVASVDQITAAAVQAVAAAQAAATVSNAAAEVQAMVDGVGDVINSVEGIGYIRGYTLDFGVSAEDVSTNTTATIIRYDHAVATDGSNVLSDVYVYFSEEPATLPVLQWASSPRVDATWTTLESVSTDLTMITVDSVQWECYKVRVSIPGEWSDSFFRVFAEAQSSVVGAFLPVRNGIQVGSYEPLTAEMSCGTNVIKFVGGVRVQ
jgi:hypothetical protein